MTLSLAFALIAAVLAVVAIFRKGDDFAAWGVLALAASIILPGLR